MPSKDCYRQGMTHSPDALVLDFVEWIAASPRRYTDVMDVWKTSCPRLTIWEEATEASRDLLTKTRRKFQLTREGQDAQYPL